MLLGLLPECLLTFKAALGEVLCQQGGFPKKDVEGWLTKLKMGGRFIIETWS